MEEYVDLKSNIGEVQIAELKRDQSCPDCNEAISQTGSSETITFTFEEELWGGLQLFSEEHDIAMSITFLSAFRVLLFRYDIENRICVVKKESPGSFVFSLLDNADLGGEKTFIDFVKRTSKSLSECERKTMESSLSTGERKSLFTTSMEYEAFDFPDIKADSFELIFAIDEVEKSGTIKFRRGLYANYTVCNMATHYKQLLIGAIKEPVLCIGMLPMLTSDERHELIEVFNETFEAGDAKTIVDLFELQVQKSPGSIAVYLDGQTMTYDELNRRSNQLARHLIAKGVKIQDNIGLLVNRDFEMIVGLYAILKAGAAYVPVEPLYPEERQLYMLKNSSVNFLLTNVDHHSERLSAGIGFVDMRKLEYSGYNSGNLGLDIRSTQLAYTIYTSGSTGRPKGVMVEHRSVVNLVRWVNSKFNIGPSDRLLFVTSICFDLSVYDVFGMLAAGGSIVIANRGDVLDVSRLTAMLQRFHITFWDSVPTTIDHVISRLSCAGSGYRQNDLRLVFMSGDWIPVALPGRIKDFFPGAQVVSLGGATEGTVWSNYYCVDNIGKGQHSIPYGRPITNNAFYILNEQLQPVPIGVKGELYIGGVGVARGYANDNEKTRLSFLPDPYSSAWGGRMYRTGDLGRMLPDMQMEFIGRKDNQVKLRGYRIELSEIESTICENSCVDKAIALYNKDKKQLISYVVPGKFYNRDTVLANLRAKLPDYMLPAKIVELDDIPLTENGKIDARALLRIDEQTMLKSDFLPPRNASERTLTEIWQKVLGLKEIGVNDHFFDIGGQSLIAVELISAIEKSTGKPLPVNSLYKYPTIALLSSFMQENNLIGNRKSLVPIRSSGGKVPLYIVHGDGLSISNFHNLAEYLDTDQPIFSLQPQGLNGDEEPLESVPEIAEHYVMEILEQNPTGPYALAGYSFGGYVAVEMKKQMEALDKKVNILAIFDTDAANVSYKKEWTENLAQRIRRQVPKLAFIVKSAFAEPEATFRYQYLVFSKKIYRLLHKLGLKEAPVHKGVKMNIDRLNKVHEKALRDFQMVPFNDKIHLFKAKSRMYFVDDFEHLGWTKYARQGVNVYEAPGDHMTMFQPPNVSNLARSLQFVLDNG